MHDSERRLSDALTAANRAIGERKKYEADAIQYQSEVADVRQELKIVDERVSRQRERGILTLCSRCISHENWLQS